MRGSSLLIVVDNIHLLTTDFIISERKQKPEENEQDDAFQDQDDLGEFQDFGPLFWLPEELDPSILKIVCTCVPQGPVYQEITHRVWNQLFLGGVDGSTSVVQ